jgi:hypothetical protein
MSNPELRFAPEMSVRQFAPEPGIGYGLAYGEVVDILEGLIVEPQGTMHGVVKIAADTRFAIVG